MNNATRLLLWIRFRAILWRSAPTPLCITQRLTPGPSPVSSSTSSLSSTPQSLRQRISPFAKETSLQIHLTVTPLLDHFVRDRAKYFGVSVSEFVRRILFNTLEKYEESKKYSVPQSLLSSTPTPIKIPPPAYANRWKRGTATPPPDAVRVVSRGGVKKKLNRNEPIAEPNGTIQNPPISPAIPPTDASNS